jgi:hypothetical protein
MALPPIITNSPIYRAFTGGQTRTVKEAGESPAAAASTGTRDSVELSEAALRKLDAAKAEDLKSQNIARGTAQDVRTELERNPELTLGLDPSAEL